MRFSTSLSLVSLLSIPTFSNAQSAINPEANPGCSTVASIVDSCAIKIPGLATAASSIVFSCLCYDASNNYAPTIYGNAATACTNFILTAYSTTGNAFGTYAAGFCTDPSFVPGATTTPPSTTGGGSSVASTAPRTTTTSETLTAAPGGVVSSGSSTSSSASASVSASTLISSIPSPQATHTSQTSSNSTSTGASAASTSSKAQGARMVAGDTDGSFWSILGSVFAGLLVL